MPDASAGAVETAETPVPQTGGVKYALKQATIRGMLVRETAPGVFAAATTAMTATVREDMTGDPAFTQAVGSQMNGGLSEVHKCMAARAKKGLPLNGRIEFGFQEQATLKDGPSASLACALMMESLLTGLPLRTDCAATGAVTAEGKIRAVGAVADKLRAVAAARLGTALIPEECAGQLYDLLIKDGPDILLAVNVHGVSDMDTAVKAAKAAATEPQKKAVGTFAKIRTAIAGKKNAAQLLAHPKSVEMLKSVLADDPTHLSAKVLLASVTGQAPTTLSPAASLESIKTIVSDLLDPIVEAEKRTIWRYGWWRLNFQLELAGELKTLAGTGLQTDQLAARVSALTKLRRTLDKRTIRLADTVQDFGNTLRDYAKLPDKADKQRTEQMNRISIAWRRVREETQRLDADRAFQDELMQ